MKNLFVILLIFTNICLGQSIHDNEIMLRNENWILSLEKINLKKDKIRFIINKIKEDSIIENKNISDRITIKRNVKEETKIIFILFQKKTGRLLDLNKHPNYSSVLKYLTPETIKSIEILKDEKATSIYGSNAICGVVVMRSDNRKLQKLTRKELRKQKTKNENGNLKNII